MGPNKFLSTFQVFYISSCTLKPADKRFSQLKNDYEMTFRESTEVLPCHDSNVKVPALSFDFAKISDLSKLEKDSLVDVLAVCKEAQDSAQITTKAGKELTKRDIVLVDDSMSEIGLTLWGSLAETFDGSRHPVLAIKGAKVSDFSGVSLSTLSSSVVQVITCSDISDT